jgi:hypothetical protein
MRYRRIIKYSIYLIILLISTNAYARTVVLPRGGFNDWPVVRSGDGKDPNYNMFRFWGPGEHNSIMILNDQGDTSTLPQDYFSPLYLYDKDGKEIVGDNTKAV